VAATVTDAAAGGGERGTGGREAAALPPRPPQPSIRPPTRLMEGCCLCRSPPLHCRREHFTGRRDDHDCDARADRR